MNTTEHPQATPDIPTDTKPSVVRQFYALTKPRVIQLIVFCALIGMVLAVPGAPSWAQVQLAAVACLGIWLVAGAAAAFNCIVEQGIDAKMKRTAWRPTARGELSNTQTLVFSAVLGLLGSALLYFWVNPLTMWLTFATFVGYAVIYTVILKPLTPQNIVIGGASGAMPPVLGWAAMTGEVGPEALILFLIIFLWTPPHFWALAIKHNDDYTAAGVPMLPSVVSHEKVIAAMVRYTIALLISSLIIVPVSNMGWVYGISALVLGVAFLWGTIALGKSDSPSASMRLFSFSISYISLLFIALTVDVFVR